MDLPLIEAVRSNPCLYNKRTLTYRNKLRREVAWLEVATSVGSNVDAVQARWKALRDRYVKELTKVEKCGKTKQEIKWKFASKMSFLRLHLKTLPLNDKEIQWDDDDAEVAEDAEEEYSDDPLFSPKSEKKQFTNSLSTTISSNVYVGNAESAVEMLSEVENNNSDLVADSEQQTTIEDLNEFMELTETEEHHAQLNTYTGNGAVPDRITTLMDAVTHLITNQVKKDEDKSRNTDFLNVLDSYLLRLPDSVQDELKVEMLNLVFNKQKHLSMNI